MRLKSFIIKGIICSFLLFCISLFSYTQEKRAMTLDDILNFKSMGNTVLSDNGKWVAYEVEIDRNDGYGVVVSTDKKIEYRVERGEDPVFSKDSRWIVFNQIPPFAATEKKNGKDNFFNHTVLINLATGEKTTIENVRLASFSNNSKFLFVHHQFVNDTLLDKRGNEKMKKAGTPLQVKLLEDMSVKSLNFVESWTADSLSRNLVFVVNDTLKANNGLYHLQINARDLPTFVIDTTGNPKFSSFSWHGKTSVLAYMRAEDKDKPAKETAELFRWTAGMELPKRVVGQEDAPQNLFLPFDNTLTWSNDGRRLFFGLRENKFSNVKKDTPIFNNVIDSLQSLAEVDIWHVNDPRIKTHEIILWDRLKRQNLLAVVHIADNRIIQLGSEETPVVTPSFGSNFVAGFNSEPYAVRITWEGNFRDFYGINVNTGRKTLIAKELEDMASVSPAGHFAIYFDDGNWYSFNLISGSQRFLTHKLDVPFYNEDHDTPGAPSSYRMMGWLDDGVSVILYDKYDIWLANLEFGTMVNITEGKGRNNQIIFRIRDIDSRPLFSARDELLIEGFNEKTKERSLYTARLNSTGVRLMRDEKMNLKWVHTTDDFKTFIYTRESYNEYPDLWSTDSRFRNPVRLTNLSAQLDAFYWGSSQLVEFNNSDGVPLKGILIKPGNFDPTKKYPVIVYFYDKFSQRLHDFNQTIINHRPSFGYYASNGYCIFLPDIHYEIGTPGMSAVKSLVPGVQKIIDMGVADKNAIGLHGHSWSGYQTAFVVTQTDIFRAAIAGAPVSNMTSAYSGIRWGSGLARLFQYETGQSRIGPSMFENLDLYIQNSPVFFAGNINTPLLIMHGDMDEAVPWEQSIELYLAMRRLGKDVIFLQYRGELHHPQKFPNKLDYTIRMKEFFDYHLKGKEPADWIIRGKPFLGR